MNIWGGIQSQYRSILKVSLEAQVAYKIPTQTHVFKQKQNKELSIMQTHCRPLENRCYLRRLQDSFLL